MSEATAIGGAEPQSSMTGEAVETGQLGVPASKTEQAPDPVRDAAASVYSKEFMDGTDNEQGKPESEDAAKDKGTSMITGGDQEEAEAEGEEPDAKATDSEDKTETKPDSGDAADKGEKFKVELPDGFEWTDDRKSEVYSFAEKLKLDDAGLQEALNFHAKLTLDDARAEEAQFKETVSEWRKQIREHEQLGGPNLNESQQNVAAFMDQFGDTEARKFLDETKAGDNPHLWAMFARVGKYVRQGAFKFGQGSGNAGPMTRDEQARTIYSNSPQLK